MVSNYLSLPVHGDSHQREDADVDAEDLDGGAELAHELGQVPALPQGRVELKRYGKEGDGHVGQGQVGDVVVGDGPHSRGHDDHIDHQAVAHKGSEADKAVEAGKQDHNGGGDIVELLL